MKTALYSLIFFIFIAFSYFFPLATSAEAIGSQASGLETIPTCTIGASGLNDQSTITFSWKDSGAFGVNYGYKFWKTGDSSETIINRSSNCFNYACQVVESGLPQNQTYNWYVKTYDTGFCLFGCDVTVNGPSVTSLTCPPVTPITKYTCNNSYQCVLSATGSFDSLSSCQAACKVPAASANNCANRSAACSNLTTYPDSICFDYPFSSNWKCTVPPNCAMNYRVGPSTAWTNSCAFNSTQPTNNCKPLGSTTCTGGLAPDNCCPGSTCQPPGADRTALGNGTCVAAGPSLGDACYVCDNAWSDTLNSCVDSAGNKTNYLSYVYCGTTQTCIQGKGCIAPPPGGTGTSGTSNWGLPGSGPSLDAVSKLLGIGAPANASKASFNSIVGLVLSLLILTAIILSLLFLIWGGFDWITSGGDKQKLQSARHKVVFAIIGLVIVFLAFFVVNVVSNLFGIK